MGEGRVMTPPCVSSVRFPMSPLEARVAMRGVETLLRSLALLAEMDGDQGRADDCTFNADLLAEARRTWESLEGGFE